MIWLLLGIALLIVWVYTWFVFEVGVAFGKARVVKGIMRANAQFIENELRAKAREDQAAEEDEAGGTNDD